MKKKMLFICTLVMMFAVLLTGCMQIEESIQVNQDGSGSISAQILFPKQDTVDMLQKIHKEEGEEETEQDILNEMKEFGYQVIQENGQEYFVVDGQTDASVKFSSIPKFYKMDYSEGNTTTGLTQVLGTSLLRTENATGDFLEVSETAFRASIPAVAANSGLADSLSQAFGKDMEESLKKAGLEDMQTLMKKTKLLFSIKFDSKIVQASEEAVLSEDDTKATFTVPAYPDKELILSASCENDIAFDGVRSGIIYGKSVSYEIPSDVTATLNGSTVRGIVTSENSKGYELCLKKADGTQKTIYYEIDKKAPTVKNLVNNGLCGGKTRVYISDEQSGIQSVTVDGKDILKQQQFDFDADDNIVTYYTMKAFKEGKHTLVAQDKLGNTITIKFSLDKTAPTVRGVKNKGVYKKPVTIKVSDKSGIKSIKLNGKSIQSGKCITKAGKYKLVVTDKAGNQRVVNFRKK